MIPSRRMPRRRFTFLAADISFAEVVTTHHKIDNPLKKEELTMKSGGIFGLTVRLGRRAGLAGSREHSR